MLISIPCALALAVAVGATPAQPPKTAPYPAKRVKDVTYCTNGSSIEGVVDKIDEDGLTLVEINERGQIVREHQFVPNDLFRKGEVIPDNPFARFTYRWQEVKRGDTVELLVRQDRDDELWYCMQISILRRPKGTLPESQNPKKDDGYLWLRIINDIENGEDVSDKDVLKACPPRPERDLGNGRVVPAVPGGLPRDWQAKLDAIREKAKKEKDKDLKAAPPDKK